MQVLYWLESIRTPVLSSILSLITHLGEETIFLVLAIMIYWCFSKKHGYYTLIVGFLGIEISQAMKLLFRIPRPWVLDPNFTIVESARAEATGYSFPSGHSQSGVGLFGGIARFTKTKWLRIVCIIICVLVPFSRIYLGVHTPLDISVGSAIPIVLIFLIYPFIEKTDENPKMLNNLTIVCLAVSLAFVFFVTLYQFPADLDEYNYTSGVSNAWKLMGSCFGLYIGAGIEKKYINFETKAVWWAQILKLVLGLGVILAVKSGLKQPLINLIGLEDIAGATRYMLVVLVASCVWPLTFKWFSKLGQKEKK